MPVITIQFKFKCPAVRLVDYSATSEQIGSLH